MHVGTSPTIIFSVVGFLTMFFAASQHKRYIATLPTTDLPTEHSSNFASLLSFIISVLGIVFAGYLLITKISKFFKEH